MQIRLGPLENESYYPPSDIVPESPLVGITGTVRVLSRYQPLKKFYSYCATEVKFMRFVKAETKEACCATRTNENVAM